MFIPRKPRAYDNSSVPRYFINPSGNESLIYFKFHVFYNNSGFHFRIRPKKEKVFTGYLKYKNRPTVKDYDAKFRIPDFTSCREEGNCSFVKDFLTCLKLNDSFIGKGTSLSCGAIPQVIIGNKNIASGKCDSLIDSLKCPQDICMRTCISLNCSCLAASMGNCSGKKHFLACHNISENKYQDCANFLWPELFYGKYKFCTSDQFRYFYGPEKFNKSGWYYIGIRYWNETQNKLVPLSRSTKAPTTTSTIRSTGSTTRLAAGHKTTRSTTSYSHSTQVRRRSDRDKEKRKKRSLDSLTADR